MIRVFAALLCLMLASVVDGRSRNFTCDENPETNVNQLLCLPSDYPKWIAPLTYGRTHIGLGFKINEVHNSDDDVVSVSCLISARWKDERIRRRRGFDHRNAQDPELLANIWRPDIRVLGEVSSVLPTAESEGVWVGADGAVLHTWEARVSFRCPPTADQTRFPLDWPQQSCKFRIGSHSKNSRQMIFTTDAVEKSASAATESFEVETLIEEDQMQGNYSLAGFELTWKSNDHLLTHYLTAYYFPSGFLVVISWFSLLLRHSAAAARVCLLSLTLLSLLTVYLAAETDHRTPASDCLNALEVWLLSCLCFVFAVFLEYGVILLKRQRSFSRTLVVERVKYDAAGNGGGTAADDEDEAEEDDWQVRVDRFWIVTLPLLFFVFNLAYWLAYLV